MTSPIDPLAQPLEMLTDGSALSDVINTMATVINAQSEAIYLLGQRVSLLESAVANGITLADAAALDILRDGGLLTEKA